MTDEEPRCTSRDRSGDPDQETLDTHLELEFDDVVSESALPHVVVCTDVDSGGFTLEGPYATGCLAIMAADREIRRDPAGLSGLRFTVQPIYPPPPEPDVWATV